MRPTLLIPALAAMALAQPHGNNRRHGLAHQHLHAKRALHTEWVVETETITKTRYIDATTTMILGPGETPPSAKPSEEAEPEVSDGGEFYEEPPKTTSQPPPPPKETTPAPEPEPEVEEEEPTPAPEPESEPTPEPESKPSPKPSPEPEPEEPEYEAPDSGSGGGGGGDSHTGDLTHYTVGMGSCGFDDSGKDNSDYIVAVSKDLMGEQSNGNPMCGKTVTISNGKKSVQATIRDKCGGCAVDDIDGSERVFLDLFGDLGVGRDTVTWSIN